MLQIEDAARCTNGRSDGLRRSIVSALEWPVEATAVHVEQHPLFATFVIWAFMVSGGGRSTEAALDERYTSISRRWHITAAQARQTREANNMSEHSTDQVSQRFQFVGHSCLH
jgi:hypothetical protein